MIQHILLSHSNQNLLSVFGTSTMATLVSIHRRAIPPYGLIIAALRENWERQPFHSTTVDVRTDSEKHHPKLIHRLHPPIHPVPTFWRVLLRCKPQF